MNHDSDLMTLPEAAGYLRAPEATLRYWRHLNVGPAAFKIGRRVVYRRTAALAVFPLPVRHCPYSIRIHPGA